MTEEKDNFYFRGTYYKTFGPEIATKDIQFLYQAIERGVKIVAKDIYEEHKEIKDQR